MAKVGGDAKERKAGLGDLNRAGRMFTKEILVPIVLALVVIQFVIQAFKIPSASMEDSLLIGDFLLGLKFIYGSPVPFSDRKLPGLGEPKPGDVLIFKFPGDPAYPQGDKERYRFLANLFLFGNLYWDRHPAPGQDHIVWYMPKDFIKRCVARSGQRIQVSGKRLLVDGKESPLPPHGKFLAFREPDPQRDSLDYRLPSPGERFDLDTLPLRDVAWIRSLAYQENPGSKVELKVDLLRDSTVDDDVTLPFLRVDAKDLNTRGLYRLLNFPREAISISMGKDSSAALEVRDVPFRKIQEAVRTGFVRPADLTNWVPPAEGGRRVEDNEYFTGDMLQAVGENVAALARETGRHYRLRIRLALDGREERTYALKRKCYFMMGDNRDNSLDSRYWGPLSADYVKAKAFIIYFSIAGDNFSWLSLPAEIRWSRIGKLID